jgi:hypothetical protein
VPLLNTIVLVSSPKNFFLKRLIKNFAGPFTLNLLGGYKSDNLSPLLLTPAVKQLQLLYISLPTPQS